MYHDEMTQTYSWYPETYLIFDKAISRYIERLSQSARDDTATINNEIERAKNIVNLIRESKDAVGDKDNEVSVGMMGKDWALVHSLLAKYSGWKDQLLRENTDIPEALEPYKEELAEVRRLLGIFEEMQVPRGKYIAVEFYTSPEKKDNSTTQQVINIGTMNGQFVGINHGNVNQEIEIEVTLKNLSDEIINSELTPEIKKESLADVLTLNAQIVGGKPDKGIMKNTLDKLSEVLKGGLTYGGSAAQIYSVVQPHLVNIQKFIESIPHF